jgi:hypothetical protein
LGREEEQQLLQAEVAQAMIKVGDLVKAREGGDLDCLAFEGEVGLVLMSEETPGEVTENGLLVEWLRTPRALWENAGDLEKLNG